MREEILEQQEAGKCVTLQTVLMEEAMSVLTAEGADRDSGGPESDECMRAPSVTPMVRVRKRMAKTETVATRVLRLGDAGRED